MAGDKVRGAKVSPIYRFQGKTLSVGTTAERLGEVQAEKHYILIISDIENTEIVYVGNEENQFIPILAGGFILLYSDLYDVYVKSESGTQKVHFIAQKDKEILYELGRLLVSSDSPNIRVQLYKEGIPIEVSKSEVDNRGIGSLGLYVQSMGHLFNESGWDRKRGNVELTILASATRTGTTNSADFTNYNHRGVIVFMRITARTVGATPQVNLLIQAKDPVSGHYQTIAQKINFDPTIGNHLVVCYPGADDVQGLLNSNDLPLPRTWRVRVEFVQEITDLTYSVGGMIVV